MGGKTSGSSRIRSSSGAHNGKTLDLSTETVHFGARGYVFALGPTGSEWGKLKKRGLVFTLHANNDNNCQGVAEVRPKTRTHTHEVRDCIQPEPRAFFFFFGVWSVEPGRSLRLSGPFEVRTRGYGRAGFPSLCVCVCLWVLLTDRLIE